MKRPNCWLTSLLIPEAKPPQQIFKAGVFTRDVCYYLVFCVFGFWHWMKKLLLVLAILVPQILAMHILGSHYTVCKRYYYKLQLRHFLFASSSHYFNCYLLLSINMYNILWQSSRLKTSGTTDTRFHVKLTMINFVWGVVLSPRLNRKLPAESTCVENQVFSQGYCSMFIWRAPTPEKPESHTPQAPNPIIWKPQPKKPNPIPLTTKNQYKMRKRV